MALIPRSITHSQNNIPRTRALFLEAAKHGQDIPPVISAAKENSQGLPSLFKLFVELTLDDPSEYTFAEEVFGDYTHWDLIRTAPWFQPYYEAYLNEAAAKRKALAFRAIHQEVASQGKNALSAAKYLIQEPWKVAEAETPADKRKARAKAKETATVASESREITEDRKRLEEMGLLN